MLSAIGSDSSESLDAGHGTFRIKNFTYSTAKAAGGYPKLGGRSLPLRRRFVPDRGRTA